MNVTTTIQWTELVWTLVALPGLVLWWRNRINAGRSLRAAIQQNVGNGRLVFARFAVKETSAWVAIEALFVLLGLFSMTIPTNQDTTTARSLITAGLLIGASLLITYLGREWRQVDEVLLGIARRRLDAREVEQNTREAEQNRREVEQNTRDDRGDP